MVDSQGWCARAIRWIWTWCLAMWSLLSLRERGRVPARVRALMRVILSISSSLERDAVLGEIARAAADLMRVPVVSFWLVDEQRRLVTLCAWSDPSRDESFPRRPLSFDESAVGFVAKQRQPCHVPDVFAPDSIVTNRAWWREHGFSSFFAMPVVHEGTVLAVLVLNGRAPFAFDASDHRLLEGFVAHAAVALRNADLFAKLGAGRAALEKQVREMGALLRVTSVVGGESDLPEALRLICRELATVTGAETVSAHLADHKAGMLRPVAAYRVPPDLMPTVGVT